MEKELKERWRATDKFKKELGIENSYQGLKTEDYYKLKAGAELDLDEVPVHLIEGKFIEKIKKIK